MQLTVSGIVSSASGANAGRANAGRSCQAGANAGREAITPDGGNHFFGAEGADLTKNEWFCTSCWASTAGGGKFLSFLHRFVTILQ